MSEVLVRWLITYFIHSSLLIVAALLIERLRLAGDLAAREFVWRVALFGGLATASLQMAFVAGPASPMPASPAIVAASAPPGAERGESAAPPAEGETPTTRVVDATGLHLHEESPAAVAGGASAGTAAMEPIVANTVALPHLQSFRWLGSAWLAIAATLALALAAQWWLLRRRSIRLPTLRDRRLAGELAAIAERAGIAVPRLARSAAIDSPEALPAATICLPEWTLETLDRRQHRALLAHEVAHLARGDLGWRLAAAAVRRALFLQPLNRIASARLDALAELACDRWAAEAGADPRALAECLVACGEHLTSRRSELAAAMAGRGSPLLLRVQSLLEPVPMRQPIRNTLARALSAAALTALLALPTLVFETDAIAGEHSSISIDAGWFGKAMEVSIDSEVGRLKARFKGDYEFNATEDDLASLSRSGYVELTADGHTRRVDFEHGDNGITRAFSVDGTSQPFEPEGRKFMAYILPTLLRETAIDVDARVARIEKRGGKDALVAEIAVIKGDYARRMYVVAAAARGTFDAGQLDRLIAAIGQGTGDYERREALTALIEKQPLGPTHKAAILATLVDFHGDYERREVLTALTPTLALDESSIAAWAKAVGAFHSDYEARQSIEALSKRRELPAAAVAAAIKACTDLHSDYESRTALSGLARHVGKSPELAIAYAKATATIHSDYEQREAITELLKSAEPDASGYHALLDAADNIKSDYECGTLLQAIAKRMPGDSALIEHYRRVARRLGDYQRGQAEKALDRLAVL